jgi:hypothetical protein
MSGQGIETPLGPIMARQSLWLPLREMGRTGDPSAKSQRGDASRTESVATQKSDTESVTSCPARGSQGLFAGSTIVLASQTVLHRSRVLQLSVASSRLGVLSFLRGQAFTNGHSLALDS